MRHAPPLWQPPAILNHQFHGYNKLLGSDGDGYLWLARPGKRIRGKENEIHVYDIRGFLISFFRLSAAKRKRFNVNPISKRKKLSRTALHFVALNRQELLRDALTLGFKYW